MAAQYQVKFWDNETLIEVLSNKTAAIALAKSSQKSENRHCYVMRGGEVIFTTDIPEIAEIAPKAAQSEKVHLCNRCGQRKPLSAFGFSMGKIRNRCKQCVNEAHKEWRDDKKAIAVPRTPEIVEIEISHLLELLEQKNEEWENLIVRRERLMKALEDSQKEESDKVA